MKKHHLLSSALVKKLLFFLFLAVSITLSWFLSPFLEFQYVLASGVMHVQVGDTVELGSPDAGGFEYSWVLKKGEQVVPQLVQGGSTEQQQSKTASGLSQFRHTFTEEGEYMIQLVRTESTSGEMQSTSVKVLVTLDPPTFEQKKAILKTLPAPQPDEKVYLSGQNAEVVFFAASSSGGVGEFHIDRDAAVDSDGDGIPDNDIDNRDHSSFFTGQSWSALYTNEKKSRVAQLTVLYPGGATEVARVEIVFADQNSTSLRSKPLKAILETIPPADQEGVIYLSGTSGKVSFYAGNSEGNITEYRIDKNIFFDTNGDGNPGNDIDNGSDPSFHTGATWETDFSSDWGDIVVELLVVDTNKKGSRIQRKIVFGEPSPLPGGIEGGREGFQKLVLSQSQIHLGENITFTLFGIPQEAKISWDFDGDGVEEISGTETIQTYQYQASGNFPVVVTVLQDSREIARFEETVAVKAPVAGETVTAPPTADFSFSLAENTFTFQNTSGADSRLLNHALTYSWDFGDDATSDEPNPIHTYVATGTYTVVLTVTDSVGRSHTTARNITVEEISPDNLPPETPEEDTSGEPATPPEEETPTEPEQIETEEETGPSTSNAEEGMGWLWIVVIIVFTPVLLVILYLVIRKIQMPDLSFEEIIAEDLERLRGMKSGTPPQVPGVVSETVAPTPEVQESPEEAPQAEVISPGKATPVSPEPAEKKQEEPAPLEGADTEPPDWLKTPLDDEIPKTEPTSSENVSSTAEGEQTESTDDMPDWLKADDPSSQSPSVEAETESPKPFVPPVTTDKTEDIDEADNTEDAGNMPDWLKGGEK